MMGGGAIIAATNMMRKRREEEQRTLRAGHTTIYKEKETKSDITISIGEEDIEMSFNVNKDFDWVRAAWALVKVCEQKGQLDVLLRTLEQENINITKGSLDMPDKEEKMSNTDFDKAELLLEKVKGFIEENDVKSHEDVHRRYTLNRQCSDLVSDLIEIVLEG